MDGSKQISPDNTKTCSGFFTKDNDSTKKEYPVTCVIDIDGTHCIFYGSDQDSVGIYKLHINVIITDRENTIVDNNYTIDDCYDIELVATTEISDIVDESIIDIPLSVSNSKSFAFDTTTATAVQAKSVSFITNDGNIPIPKDKGEYATTNTYDYYDRVSYNGSLWLCINKNGVGENISPGSDETTWLEQVKKGQQGNPAYAVNIIAKGANGNYLRNGEGSVTLTASVYDGINDITQTLEQSKFSWERDSGLSESDATWNLQHKAIGNILIINDADVFKSAVFSCTILI